MQFETSPCPQEAFRGRDQRVDTGRVHHTDLGQLGNDQRRPVPADTVDQWAQRIGSAPGPVTGQCEVDRAVGLSW